MNVDVDKLVLKTEWSKYFSASYFINAFIIILLREEVPSKIKKNKILIE